MAIDVVIMDTMKRRAYKAAIACTKDEPIIWTDESHWHNRRLHDWLAHGTVSTFSSICRQDLTGRYIHEMLRRGAGVSDALDVGNNIKFSAASAKVIAAQLDDADMIKIANATDLTDGVLDLVVLILRYHRCDRRCDLCAVLEYQ